ncbi:MULTISPECIES: hypothetical protein [Romboutsia]|uniref:hypothetical protein n=1 Tax=Romboutsia TaxID=1501226 RepID=UPI000A4A1C62|nr:MULTISPECIES: hypothetical protein [Romboutsia]MCH1958844.1 hypothetical protein [Romboutsia hominis]MCH1967972.1 hypothetical protein [Romboutsia hominis]MDB8791877.1 hypothetical protein [Romboutsia sp. 1001216sp1]MDB8794892.1 hypothetical protein [Romboutsia sp. 1001216sp1]MDB8797720.1 hypothetical protein [Romboutsia sp. 1001216sp1]
MKSTMSLEERKALKEKREKNLKSKGKTKFTESDDMSLLIKKKNSKAQKSKNSCFRNNYKKYQYDYEEDFYEPTY